MLKKRLKVTKRGVVGGHIWVRENESGLYVSPHTPTKRSLKSELRARMRAASVRVGSQGTNQESRKD